LLDDATVLSLFVAGNGTVWIATDGLGLFAYDGATFRQYTDRQGLSSNTVNAVRGLEDGTILAGTAFGLDKISEGLIQSIPFFNDRQINYLLIDDFENVWLAAEKGLGRVNMQRQLFDFWTEGELAAPLSRINSLCFDREGSMWIATGRSGLIRVKQSAVANLGVGEGLSYDIVNVISEHEDVFFIGTDEGKIDMIDQAGVRPVKISTHLKGAGIRDIAHSTDGTQWVATYAGLLLKKGSQEKLLTMEDGLPANDLRRILIDKHGFSWVATRSGGLVKMKGERVLKVYDRNNGLGSNYILAVEESPTEAIYVGTHSGGLSIVYPNDSISTYHIRGEDSGVLIFNIHIDEEGNVWVVSNLGLYHFANGQFRRIELEVTSAGETYFDWVEDREGNYYVTTNVGILLLRKADLQRYLAGDTKTIAGRMYDDTDGMRNKECTGATRALLSSKGEIWVPTIEGVAIMNTRALKKNELKPPVYITNLLVDSKEIPIVGSEAVALPAGSMRFVFRFTGLSLRAPTKVKLRYRLEGLDKDWINASQAREAEYTNLPPGNYTFRVIAANNDGVWNEVGDSFAFRVKPFFYQTWLFYVTLVALVALLIYVAFRLRVRAIERRNRELRKLNSELDRFVYSASHDLRAPLTSILGLVNVFRIDNAPQNKEMYLEKIEQSVLKLDHFIHDIIDFSRNARLEVKPERIDFQQMIHEICDDLKYLDREDKIQRRVVTSGTFDFYTDPKRLRIVLSNLISNAIRYHNLRQEHPFIEMSAEILPHQAIVRVKDNGRGISSEHIEHIFKMFYRADEDSKGSGLGLYIVKETLEKINGHIDVHSELYKGTTFEIRLPSLKPH